MTDNNQWDFTEHELPDIDTGSELFRDKVKLALQNMLVQAEAKRVFEQRQAKSLPIPEGVLIDAKISEEDIPELIDGVLLSNGAVGIIGEKETGKSLCALEIQYSLVTGTPLWALMKPNKTVQKTVHFLAEHSSKRLMWLYKDIMKLPATGNIKIYGPEHLGWFKLLVNNGVRREVAVTAYKKMAEGAGLVVFDPLAAFLQGEGAENDNNAMRSLVDTMVEIADSTGAACLVLGHQGKPTTNNKTGKTFHKSVYATRGASAAEDAMSGVLYLNKIEDEEDRYQLKQRHYKGKRVKPIKLIRDPETYRQKMAIAKLT